ncbi:MAG: sulfatase [Solirubrobacteraceae bacterium]|nr:sulfatase [Solirubrobacteraceae bacterium]
MPAAEAKRPPNLVLVITDQQRPPMHWGDVDQEWLDRLTPADAELRRTGLTFDRAYTATAMCSPSRASFLTGTYPSRHGVTLTLTEERVWSDPKNLPWVLAKARESIRDGAITGRRLARSLARNIFRVGPKSGGEPELPAGIDTLATMLQAGGYHVALRGKWHLTRPLNGESWTMADGERIERDYGFEGWEPADAGGDILPENFGGGNGGPGEGWDEVYTRQVEAFLAREDLPEPFCLVVSFINPHDVLAYPETYREGGYSRDEFADLNLPLPPSVDESLREKPVVQAMVRLGLDGILGPLKNRGQQRDYVNFYAHLQRVVDRHIARVLEALGDPGDPGSVRSRTVIARISDHGDMGMSHGGLRQKVFNAYEETIRVPLVVSNPVCYTEPARTDALASLVDIVPTFLGLAGVQTDATIDGCDLTPVLANYATPDEAAVKATGVDLSPIAGGAGAETVRDHVLFTYDDHQASMALQNGPGQPNRIRCVRDGRWKYAVYLDPDQVVAPQYECYDLEEDPDEVVNLVDRDTGRGRTPEAERERVRLNAVLRQACEEAGMTSPPVPAAT